MGWSLYYLVHGIVLDAVFVVSNVNGPLCIPPPPSTCLASLRFAGLSLPLLCWAELSCTVTVSCPHGRKFLLLLASTAAAAIRSWFESRKRKPSALSEAGASWVHAHQAVHHVGHLHMSPASLPTRRHRLSCSSLRKSFSACSFILLFSAWPFSSLFLYLVPAYYTFPLPFLLLILPVHLSHSTAIPITSSSTYPCSRQLDATYCPDECRVDHLGKLSLFELPNGACAFLCISSFLWTYASVILRILVYSTIFHF
jgi:hypothetical protein